MPEAERGPFPPLPPGTPSIRRVVSGADLSDTSLPRLVSKQELTALTAKFKNTLFLNAASINATHSHIQHGIGCDPNSKEWIPIVKPDKGRCLRSLRPPIVVRLRKGAAPEVVPLGVGRFPEGDIPKCGEQNS